MSPSEKDEVIEVEGEVTEAPPNTTFRVMPDNEHEVLAHMSGKTRRFRIRINPGTASSSSCRRTASRAGASPTARSSARRAGGGARLPRRVWRSPGDVSPFPALSPGFTRGAMNEQPAPTVAADDAGAERRAHPRVPTDLGVVLEWGGRRVMGVTVDSSEQGLGIALRGTAPPQGESIAIRLNLPEAGWHRLRGEVAYASAGDEGVTIGVRIGPDGIEPAEPSGPPTTRDGHGRRPRVRGSRAKPRRREPRPRPQAMAELRALGSYVYEQAILGDAEAPTAGTVAWVAELAEELGVEPPGPADDFHGLMLQLAELHRRVSAAEG